MSRRKKRRKKNLYSLAGKKSQRYYRSKIQKSLESTGNQMGRKTNKIGKKLKHRYTDSEKNHLHDDAALAAGVVGVILPLL